MEANSFEVESIYSSGRTCTDGGGPQLQGLTMGVPLPALHLPYADSQTPCGWFGSASSVNIRVVKRPGRLLRSRQPAYGRLTI